MGNSRDKKLYNKTKYTLTGWFNTHYKRMQQRERVKFGRDLTFDRWLLLFTEDVLKYAIELSVLQNKKTFSYFEGILNNWKSCGYKTLQEIKDNDIKQNKTEAVVPKWFDKKIESEEASAQEQQEMVNILSGF